MHSSAMSVSWLLVVAFFMVFFSLDSALNKAVRLGIVGRRCHMLKSPHSGKGLVLCEGKVKTFSGMHTVLWLLSQHHW